MTTGTELVCAVTGCDRPMRKEQWCEPHYRRFKRYGHPEAGRASPGSCLAEIERAISEAQLDPCWTWPFATAHGYGTVAVNNRMVFAHRVVCERVRGAAPSSKHEAAHSCGRGRFGCINPHHLRWATRRENMADRVLHGTSNRGSSHGLAKLTPEAVIAIRREYATGQVLQRELAEKYNIKQETVSGLVRGTRWGWLQNEGDRT